MSLKVSATPVAEPWTGFDKLRILAGRGPETRRLCKVLFTKADASIYLVPYGSKNEFAVGTDAIQAGVESLSFEANALPMPTIPKLSIHQSGQVHANAGQDRVGPLQIPALELWTGAHLATVLASSYQGLPLHRRLLRHTNRTRDFRVELGTGVDSLAIAIYANGNGPTFDQPGCQLTFTVGRPTLARPLYFGVHIRPQIAFDPGVDGASVIAIAGWTPGLGRSEPAPFLSIRAT